MNSWEIYKILLAYILFNCRFDLVRCTEPQGGSPTPFNGGSSTPATPTRDKSQDKDKNATKVDLNIKTDKQATNQFKYVKNESTKTAKYTSKEGYHPPQRTSTAHGTLIDIDITSKRSTNKVKYYWDQENGTDVYTALSPYLISRVFKGDKVIWKAKDGNYPVMVSVGVNERGKPKLTVLYPGQEDHHLKSYRKSTSGPVVTGREHRPAPPVDYRYRPVRGQQDPHLVILDIRTSGDTEEFKYYHDIENNMLVFTASPHHLFHSIVKGEKVLWTAKRDMYPHIVTVGVNERGKPSLTLFYPTDEDLTPEGHRTYATGRQPITRRTHRPDTPYTDRKLSLRRDQHHDLVVLDIDLRHTLEYEYHWNKRDRLYVFTANYPFAFHSIVKGDKVLWTAKDRRYPVKVTVGINERGKPRLTVFYPDETYRPPTPLPRVKRPPTVPTPPVTERVEPSVKTVELDIERDRVTTKSYYYLKDDLAKIATYSCKEGYGFSGVKLRNTQIWKASGNDYANKVVVYGVGQKEMALDINLPSGNKKVFSKAGENYPWTELKSKGPEPLDQSQHPTEVKITTKGSTTENDTDKYTVYKREGADEYEYKLNQNVKCTAIKCSDKEVWKRESCSDNPDSFTYNKTDVSLVLYFGLDYIKFTKDTSSGSWKRGERESIIKITTEGSDGKSSENDKSKYKVTKVDGKDEYEYTFNKNVKCTRITHKGEEVWNIDSDSTDNTNPYLDSFIYNKTLNSFLLFSDKKCIKDVMLNP